METGAEWIALGGAVDDDELEEHRPIASEIRRGCRMRVQSRGEERRCQQVVGCFDDMMRVSG